METKKEIYARLSTQDDTGLHPRGTVATPGLPLRNSPGPSGMQGNDRTSLKIDELDTLLRRIRTCEEELKRLHRAEWERSDYTRRLRKFFGYVFLGCLVGLGLSAAFEDLRPAAPYYGAFLLVALTAWLTA